MQSLDRAIVGITDAISVPWPRLARLIRPGPGHVILALGRPGAGKSTLALYWALKMHEPAMILSFDTDLSTQAARICAMHSGQSQDAIMESLPQWQNWLKANNRTLPLMLDSPIGLDEVGDTVMAGEEFFGEVPKLVVVDNLKDIVAQSDYASNREAVRALKRMARKTHTCVLLLHHTNRQGDNSGYQPIRQRDGEYGGEQDAEFVLGLWKAHSSYEGRDYLRVGILKNRFGVDDSDGRNVYVDLADDREHMYLGD